MLQRRDRSLRDWPLGTPAILLGSGVDPRFGHRLAQLGLRSGATVTPLQRTPGGGVVLATGELRLALDAASVAALRVRTPASAGSSEQVAWWR